MKEKYHFFHVRRQLVGFFGLVVVFCECVSTFVISLDVFSFIASIAVENYS